MSALNGFNVWIFAYGQTGSGKTHTMMGDLSCSTNQGIIPRTITSLFSRLNAKSKEGYTFSINCWIQEVYMDQINDLLDPDNCMKQISQCSNYSPTLVQVSNTEEVLHLVNSAFSNRIVADNKINSQSSRSHCIFQLQIELNSNEEETLSGSISLIDLAGSERLHKIENVSSKILKESIAINKSLSWLKEVIKAIASNGLSDSSNNPVPFRNSKLTWLLQKHLGSSGAKTLMIVNASALPEHLTETTHSLRFASEVNSVII